MSRVSFKLLKGTMGTYGLPHLCVDELDDVGVAAQALQQRDLVYEPRSGFAVPPGQADALQRKDLAVRSHDLVYL